MRQPRKQDRRAPELERTAAKRGSDRQGLPLMARWRVDIIRKRAEHLGTVEAAIEKAAERFEIPPERRNRIAVQKMGKGD
jgi:hypothetical protein